METQRCISISEIFSPEAEGDPFIEDVLEWSILPNRDGKSSAITYDRSEDALCVVGSFSERVSSWNSAHQGTEKILMVRPDGGTYRAFLDHRAFIHTQLGRIFREDDHTYLLLQRFSGLDFF